MTVTPRNYSEKLRTPIRETHDLPLPAREWPGQLTVATAVAIALAHVPDDIDPADVAAVEDLLRNLPVNVDGLTARLTADQYDLLATVLSPACEYMHANGYADNPEYPEDQYAASLLGSDGGPALVCLVHHAACRPMPQNPAPEKSR
ncbi:hypothetical protein [Lentzea kentuckyensis]|jgi:hypothetical protein|uniref:hypothetical protein n=1 Tax=Lentzea kentuckyensis TaxID=360086 RepID=UPI000A3615E7|nr:hypothetical protein [Lentzea kentuckyensis]